MKFLKWFLIVVGILILVAVVGFEIMKSNTKKHSPEETVSYVENGYDLSVTYSRPFKKEREIFGSLVPYGEVWRTGANEATVFTTGTDLVIAGQELPAGTYTLWTIPGPKKWEVFFNSGSYGWGVNLDGKAQRDPGLDVVAVTVQKQRNFKVFEQFTISFQGDPALLMMAWDYTRADVLLEKK